MALAIAFQWLVIPEETGRLSLTILNHVQFFLLGFLLADIYLVEWRSAPARTGGWDVVSLIGWPCLALTWQTRPGIRIVFPALLLLLYCAAFRGRWSSRVFSNRWVTTIGGMCYTIYLLHYTLISFIGRHTRLLRISDIYAIELLWQFVLITPGVLLGSAIFFVLIERPCMQRDWPQRLAATVRRTLGTATTS
jgi:peptidoglycan/LPS O-acetylase OafA/YrhL